MIKEENGRTRSERTTDEIADLLARDIASLTPDEKEALKILLAEMQSTSKKEQPSSEADVEAKEPREPDEVELGPSLFQMLRNADYKREPVDMETFVRDPFYLGNTCDSLYPRLMDDLKELFSGDYFEAILTGSIGYGKTFLASIGICRILYELSCMKDPQRSFGLSSVSSIDIVVLSVTEELAMKAAFENITSKIQASPYFQQNFPFEPTQKEIRFPQRVRVTPRATNDTSALGLNVISFLLDESNFMPKNKKNAARGTYGDMASQIYSNLRRRIVSRFERRGRVPGIIFIVSSKQTSDDFTSKRINESLHDPRVFVIDYAIWDVRPEMYTGISRFPVLVGNEQLPSKLLSEKEHEEYKVKPPPEGCNLIMIPETYRKLFEDDLEGSIRDTAGLATVSVRPFIAQRDKIFEAIAADEAFTKKRLHPFTKEVWIPSEGGGFIWERLIKEAEERQADGVIRPVKRPIYSPHALRHSRFDQSLTQDATGFCMGHIVGFKDVVRRDDHGRPYGERAPLIFVDVLLRIQPPVGGELLLADNRRLLYELTSNGFAISKVTLDSYQSVDTVQTLKSNGYNAELLSVDLDTEPYEELKNALYEGRILFYEYNPLIEELKTLQKNIVGTTRKRPKIDHPPNGSKDVSDSLAGVVHTLTLSAAVAPMPILQDGNRATDAWSVGMASGSSPSASTGGPLPILSSSDGVMDGVFGMGDDDWSWYQ